MSNNKLEEINRKLNNLADEMKETRSLEYRKVERREEIRNEMRNLLRKKKEILE